MASNMSSIGVSSITTTTTYTGESKTNHAISDESSRLNISEAIKGVKEAKKNPPPLAHNSIPPSSSSYDGIPHINLTALKEKSIRNVAPNPNPNLNSTPPNLKRKGEEPTESSSTPKLKEKIDKNEELEFSPEEKFEKSDGEVDSDVFISEEESEIPIENKKNETHLKLPLNSLKASDPEIEINRHHYHKPKIAEVSSKLATKLNFMNSTIDLNSVVSHIDTKLAELNKTLAALPELKALLLKTKSVILVVKVNSEKLQKGLEKKLSKYTEMSNPVDQASSQIAINQFNTSTVLSKTDLSNKMQLLEKAILQIANFACEIIKSQSGLELEPNDLLNSLDSKIDELPQKIENSYIEKLKTDPTITPAQIPKKMNEFKKGLKSLDLLIKDFKRNFQDLCIARSRMNQLDNPEVRQLYTDLCIFEKAFIYKRTPERAMDYLSTHNLIKKNLIEGFIQIKNKYNSENIKVSEIKKEAEKILKNTEQFGYFDFQKEGGIDLVMEANRLIFGSDIKTATNISAPLH